MAKSLTEIQEEIKELENFTYDPFFETLDGSEKLRITRQILNLRSYISATS